MSKHTRAVQRTLAAHRERRGYADGGSPSYDPMTGLRIGGEMSDEPAPDPQGAVSRVLSRLTGTQFGEPRSQLWPEKMVRSGTTLAGDLLSGKQRMHPLGLRHEDFNTDPTPSGPTEDSTWLGRKLGLPPVAAGPHDEVLERVGDMAGLAGGQTLMTGRKAPLIKETAHERPAVPAEAHPGETPVDVGRGLAGATGGDESLRAAQLQAQRWAGERKPLEGLPVQPQNVDGELLVPGPVARAHDVAERYMQGKDFGVPHPDRFHPIDKEHAQRIAQAFEDMPHAPKDPEVKAAYEALAQETLDQYRAIREHGGLEVTPVNGADYPYHGNPRAVVKDVANNNHMAFFKTNEGFGTNFHADPDHVLLRSSGEKVGDHDMLFNDLFRVVHDYFGHVKNGNGFRGAGEDNAWRAHAAMYSPLARRAMTTETRGQNSWLNYGPHGEKNRTANAADTTYADQKIGLMPEWTMHEPGWKPTTLVADSQAVGAPLAALEHAAERAQQQGFNIDAYHGTDRPQFDAFKRKQNDIGIHFGTAEQANDRLSYMADRRTGDQHVYPVKLKLKNPLRLPDLGGWGAENLDWGLRNLRDASGLPVFRGEDIQRALYGPGSPRNESGKLAALRNLIERKGYDGIVYKNTGEVAGSGSYREIEAAARKKVGEAFGEKKYSFSKEEQQHPAYKEWSKAMDSYRRHRETMGEDSYIAFRPNQVRSRFAKFDPKDAKKGGLLLEDSATAGAALAGLEKSSGVHYAPPRQYYQHELNTSGNPIINKGVENPPDPRVQTVADPHRMMFPGIYGNPREIALRAAERVGAEDPAMKRLFNVTRGDLREMAQGRVGNEEPALKLAKNPRGSVSAQNIQTPQNTQRLVDILGEAGKHEGLRTADAWYIQDPVFNRMKQMGSNDPVAQYRKFNTMTAMASPGSDVMTEIQRGTAAHWLHKTGRFDDFQKYAGVPEDMRARVKFPADMRYIGGHPYHRTSQGDPMAKYLEHGSIQTDAAKVPLYAHASGTPETGFQTKGPVGDAHFSRGVGLTDTRKGPTDVGSSFSKPEYQTLQPWWQHDVAGKVGLESVPAQARLWTTLGPQTGVDSALGAPKLELLAKQIMETAKRLRISPEKARDLVLSGKAGAGARGGAVGPRFADGGEVGDAMAKALKTAKAPAANFAPLPMPEYNVPMPSVSVEDRGAGAPHISGSMSLGDVDVSGGYQRYNNNSPPRWSAMVNYRKSFAEGGALPPAPWATEKKDDATEPLPAAPWDTGAPSVPISGPDGAITAPPRVPAKPQGPALVEAGKGAARGPLNFLGDMGEAVMGPFGPSKHAANLYSTITGGPRPTPDEPYSAQLHKATGVDSTNPGYAGSIAETVTNPASWIGPGGPVAKGVVAAASGAGGQLGSDLTEGSPLGRAGGALVAGPLAARTIKPQLAPAQQTLADARVPMTPGQLPGGFLKNLEDKATSIPILGHFISNARTRSVEGFNRSVGNQALEPIGGQIPRGTPPGHQMVAQVEHQLSDAYDRVVPHLQFAPDHQFATEMLAIHQRNHGQLPPAQVDQFNRIMASSFGRGGNMTGQKIKTIEEELGKVARNYSSSPMPAERDLGYAVTDTLRALRGNLERVNPQYADELQRINSGWAMYVRMRDAAGRRVTSEGVFMPSDLLAAVKRGDRSAGKGSFARGDALMQDFAEAGQHVLPSKVPDSGTAGRALAAAATGALGGGHLAGYVPAKAMAAIGAASSLYTRPSTWLLNNYTRPTTGVRAGYSAAGRGAGTVAAPLANNPFGDDVNPYAP